ncbi:PREDICTED: probable 2-oxoglutarate-dependent dioxygenase AOP1, partial [Erythranthe guttata]|uniref:probable 2-oxoglutarate-dependent dioxygenase AOP1 n=1 Tax=Erythranthe guttata TaxID=4155 RepID=UPI00064DCE50
MGSLSQEHKLDVIEFSDKNSKPGTESWSKTCDEVVSALEKYGCFVASYDKLTQETHTTVFQALEELFDLPTQTKVQNKSTKPLYGYVGQIPFIPLYESMGIDDADTLQGIQNFAKVMWPNGNNDFRYAFFAYIFSLVVTISAHSRILNPYLYGKLNAIPGYLHEKLVWYTKLAAELEKIVVQMVFERYGVGKHYESLIGSANYLCRVMKYREPKSNENNMGFVSHTDKSFMSTIHQNQVDGLEIKTKDGEWFGVHQLSSSSVIV